MSYRRHLLLLALASAPAFGIQPPAEGVVLFEATTAVDATAAFLASQRTALNDVASLVVRRARFRADRLALAVLRQRVTAAIFPLAAKNQLRIALEQARRDIDHLVVATTVQLTAIETRLGGEAPLRRTAHQRTRGLSKR